MEPDRWLGLELRHLLALKAVAEQGSFGRAARSLGYTQSAVSQQIATLERIVGMRLIERPGGPRPVSLTQAGTLLLRHADGISARLQAAHADLAALQAGDAGPLRVGTFQSVGARILPSGAREVEIELFVTDGDEARRLVEDVAQIVPAGPTRFVRRPVVVELEALDVQLTRMLISATVAHGREWLVNDFLPDILKERAPEGLIAHGPVVMFVDDRATRRFARSMPASSRQPR